MVFILLCFAVYRVSLMLCRESGPADVFLTLRTRLDSAFIWGDLFRCFNCMSVWVSLILSAIAASATSQWSLYPVLWLGSSGVACCIDDLMQVYTRETLFVGQFDSDTIFEEPEVEGSM